MKAFKTIVFAALAIAATILVAYGAIKLADGLSGSGKVTAKCDSERRHNYKLVINNDHFTPDKITASRCDTLEIINRDDRGRLLAFGQHDRHLAYDGITERFLTKDESFSVTLIKSGNFLVHDHNDEEVQAKFVVR